MGGLDLGNGVSEEAENGIVGIGERFGFGGRNGFGNLRRRRCDLGGDGVVVGGFGCRRRRHEDGVRPDFADQRWRRRFAVNRHFVRSENVLSSYLYVLCTTSLVWFHSFLSPNSTFFYYFITVLDYLFLQ